MSSHLDEAALEALSHAREDLVSAEVLAHLDACPECAQKVHEARALSHALGPVMRAATPEAAELDALVRSVVATAPPRLSVPRASRRSLRVGVMLAAPAALVLGLASLTDGLGVGTLLHGARDAWTVGFTFARLAAVHVSPAALATAAATGALLVALLSAAMRVLMRGPRELGPAVEVVR
jgi:anti-sigma factor RsiW